MTVTVDLGPQVHVWVDQCPDCRPILVISTGSTEIHVQPGDDRLTDADRLAAEALTVAVLRYQATVRSRLSRRMVSGSDVAPSSRCGSA